MSLSKWLTLAGVAAAALCAASNATAGPGVLYSNGPINGTINSWNITDFQVSDSFTLTKTSVVTEMTFGAWLDSGSPLLSVDWGISSSPFADDGSSAPSSSFHVFGTEADSETISIGPLKLAPGLYYITLSHAVQSDGTAVFWDENDGPSSAGLATPSGTILPGDPAGSESFQILGNTAVPEPATWAMMLLGLLGVGALQRSRCKEPRGISVI